MKSSTATLAVLGAALLALCAVSTVDAANMDKYYKRTGAKFLAQKAAEEDVHKLPSGMLYKVRTASYSTLDTDPPNPTRVGLYSHYGPIQLDRTRACAQSSTNIP